MSYSRPTITLNEGSESNNNNHHEPSNNNHHPQSTNSFLSSSTKPSSHSTVSNTPNPTTTTTTSNSSSTNQSPAGIHRTTSNTVTPTTVSKQTLLQQQQPNVVGKIPRPNPTTTSPHNHPNNNTPTNQQQQQQQSIDYVAIKNATLTRTYPALSPNIFLLTPDGRLKPSSERERVFQDLEARIVSLKAKCGEIVKGAKALHRACNAVVQLNQNGGNNGTGFGAVGEWWWWWESWPWAIDSIWRCGAGVSKKRANGSGSALLVVSGSTGNVALKEKLKEELNRLVGEGRRLRESIEASPFLDGKPMS
ncbi:hypothetical protein BDR26DRAFT_857848 [Obelidium mucronatum]|nr:hypothetical protein BDR26DRAFT_857848 [Obelidium mucronatum]